MDALPHDVLRIIVNDRALESRDHASLAIACHSFNNLVTHARLTLYGDTDTPTVSRLRCALRAALKRGGGCVELNGCAPGGVNSDRDVLVSDLLTAARREHAAVHRLEVVRIRSCMQDELTLLGALPALRRLIVEGNEKALTMSVDKRVMYDDVIVVTSACVDRLRQYGRRVPSLSVCLAGAFEDAGRDLLAAFEAGVRCDTLRIGLSPALPYAAEAVARVAAALANIADGGRIVVHHTCSNRLALAVVRASSSLRELKLTVDADGLLASLDAALRADARIARLDVRFGKLEGMAEDAGALRRIFARVDELALEHFPLALFPRAFDDATALKSLDATRVPREDVTDILASLPPCARPVVKK